MYNRIRHLLINLNPLLKWSGHCLSPFSWFRRCMLYGGLRSLTGFFLNAGADWVLELSHSLIFARVHHHFDISIVTPLLLRKVDRLWVIYSLSISSFTSSFTYRGLYLGHRIIRKRSLILFYEALPESIVTISNYLLKFRNKELFLMLNGLNCMLLFVKLTFHSPSFCLFLKF